MQGQGNSDSRHVLGKGFLTSAIAVAVVVGVALVASANAAWLPAKNVAAPANVSESAVAVAPDGVATVVWSAWDDPGVWARRYGAGGAPIGPAFELSDVDEVRTIAAVDAGDGSVLVMWSHGSGITTRTLEARWIDADGNPNPVTHELGVNLQDSDVAVAPDRRATVVWNDNSVDPARIAVRQILPNGTLTATELLSAAGGNAGEPFVAVAPEGEEAGTVTATFIRYDGTGYTVHARRIDSEGAISATTHDVSVPPATPNDSGYYPSVDVDPDGVATIVWQQTSSGGSWIRARRLLANGTLADAIDLSPPAGGVRRETAIAVDPAGNAVIGWTQRGEDSNYRARARVLDSTGALGETLPLGPEGTDFVDDDWISIAATVADRATLVWGLDDDDAGASKVWGRDLANGELGPRVELGGHYSELPRVAADADGVATAIWAHYDEDTEQGSLRITRSDPFASANLRAAAKAPKRVAAGSKLGLRVRVRNRGNAGAAKVRACPKLAGKSKRAFKILGRAKGCKSAGDVGPGRSKVVRLALKAKPKALRPGVRYKLTVLVTGRDATSGDALPKSSATVRVRGKG